MASVGFASRLASFEFGSGLASVGFASDFVSSGLVSGFGFCGVEGFGTPDGRSDDEAPRLPLATGAGVRGTIPDGMPEDANGIPIATDVVVACGFGDGGAGGGGTTSDDCCGVAPSPVEGADGEAGDDEGATELVGCSTEPSVEALVSTIVNEPCTSETS